MSVSDARKTVESFFEAFNARDHAGMQASLNYPHVRFASGRVQTWNEPAEFLTPFKALEEREGWHHSTLDACEPVHAGADKVHLDVRFRRYHADGTCYASYQTLWIVTRQDGHWGIQARSSYAP